MSIIRVNKKANGYFIAPNGVFNDERLSWEARGVMGYLLSKYDGWECRNYDLINQTKAGKHVISRIMKELQETGYIHRYRVSDGRGSIQWRTEIYERPEDNPHFALSKTDFSTVEIYDDVKYDDVKSVDIINTDNNKDLPTTNTEKNISANAGKSSNLQNLTDEEKFALLAFGQFPDSDEDEQTYNTIQEIKDSGWIVNDPIIERAIVHYLVAVRLKKPSFAIPRNQSVRKDWYKDVKGHLMDYREKDLPDLYRVAIERLSEAKFTYFRPGSLTKILPEVVNEPTKSHIVAEY